MTTKSTQTTQSKAFETMILVERNHPAIRGSLWSATFFGGSMPQEVALPLPLHSSVPAPIVAAGLAARFPGALVVVADVSELEIDAVAKARAAIEKLCKWQDETGA